MTKIETFSGEYRWLSNFWPCSVEFEGLVYPSSENAYQASKSLDQAVRSRFVDTSAAASKKLGRQIEKRDAFDDMKVIIMERILIAKFYNSTLRASLLDTGDAELIEGNTWNDRFWGVCRGEGQNMLGRVLMRVRLFYQEI